MSDRLLESLPDAATHATDTANHCEWQVQSTALDLIRRMEDLLFMEESDVDLQPLMETLGTLPAHLHQPRPNGEGTHAWMRNAKADLLRRAMVMPEPD